MPVVQLLATFTCLYLLVPASASAQRDALATQRGAVPMAPTHLDGFVISEVHQLDDQQLGTQYRYTKPGEPVYDVYLYPYLTTSLATTDDGRIRAAKAEADLFFASLRILQRHGYLDEYRIAFSATDSTHTLSRVLLGSVAAVAVRRRGQVSLSFFYAYGLSDAMVKVRTDLSPDQLKTVNVAAFVHDLIAQLAGN
jgi:ABC-type glycerol-3-phosphate transport system permease component